MINYLITMINDTVKVLLVLGRDPVWAVDPAVLLRQVRADIRAAEVANDGVAEVLSRAAQDGPDQTNHDGALGDATEDVIVDLDLLDLEVVQHIFGQVCHLGCSTFL